MNLTSDRTRRGRTRVEGGEEGQELGALLGYVVESMLHRAELYDIIDDLRKAFPISTPDEPEFEDQPTEAVSARNVCDGIDLADAYIADKNFSSRAELKNAI